MKSVPPEVEFLLQYSILFLLTCGSLYNLTAGIQIEFSKLILTLVLGVVCPNPRLKAAPTAAAAAPPPKT